MNLLRFDGKVVLVTGAGGGIGKAYALHFAERGASVVVNDLGGDFTGTGKSSRPADVVVEEIHKKGGQAIANYDSVEHGNRLIETALNSFGKIDIVVNNAGIIRDKSFSRLSDQDWDLVHNVHLKGAFKVTQAAWPHMKKNGYGRIIMTASSSGLYGNFGQANYSSAKLGLVGLSNTLAKEGSKYNIHCNTISPTAGSRMSNTVLPTDLSDSLKPEYMAPLVLYLCHDTCEENGGLFEVGGGWVSQLRWERSIGAILRSSTTNMTPEAVRNHWYKIKDFTNADHPTSNHDTMSALITVLEKVKVDDTDISPVTNALDSNGNGFDPELAMLQKIDNYNFTYEAKDAILYALGIGVSTQQEDYLKYLFEGDDNFCVFPTYAVIPAQASMMGIFSGQIPGLEVNLSKLLHGEQYLEVYQPLSASSTVTSKLSIVDILDKGSGCVILLNVDTFNEFGETVSFNQFTLFVVGSGGYGGKRHSYKSIPLGDKPKRPADVQVQERTSFDQAALYRLSGDQNPLHIDPAFATLGGFSTPILHGLCSLGYACRHVMKQYANNDVALFKAVKVRMAKPVIPGQTLQTSMWQEDKRIHFECKVVENDNMCLTGAYVDLHDVVNEKKKKHPIVKAQKMQVEETVKPRQKVQLFQHNSKL